MKIFGWVQSKITGRQEKNFDISHGFDHCFSKQNSCKEEFHGWPQTLLSVGTFGSNEMQNETQIISQTSESLQENGDLSIEEVIILQNEISKLLNLKQVFSSDKTDQSSSLKLGNISTSNICNGSTDEINLSNAKELLAAKHNEIRRRTLLPFLLKKIFVCRSGFAPQLSLRDAIPESWIEKILRKILFKNIHPPAAPRSTSKKYLQRIQQDKKWENGSKWVKTDSEYIILEILEEPMQFKY